VSSGPERVDILLERSHVTGIEALTLVAVPHPDAR
jgi:hypothetical protein